MSRTHPDPGIAGHAPGVDAENPWPGLAPFTEDQQAFFHGRSRDSAELLRMVKRESLTVLYGRSGLGKSSLLQAGLFPLLRKEDGLPVYVRLDHSPNAPTLTQQAFAALTRAAEQAQVEFVPPTESASLWEYFQHIDTEFWTARNRPATIVLVFDQFEEIFTLARTDESARKRAQEFIAQLSDLVEHRVPEALKAQFDNGEQDVDQFEFDQARCKVVLSLREDYVPELQTLRSSMRSIMVVSNWKRVLPMSGREALEAVRQPGSTIVDEDVARKIVEFVAAGSKSGEHGLSDRATLEDEPPDAMAELVIEPALLSVVCFELNRKRRARNQSKITANILAESSTEILRDFYERSVSDVPQSVRSFVEDRLLTAAGHRNSEHVDEALRVDGMTTAVLEKLIGRRLVRLDTRLGATRIELTHDRLAEPVRSSREQRQGKLKAEAALAEASRRRRRLVGQAFTALSALCVVFFFVALWNQYRAQRERDNAVNAMRDATEKGSLAQEKQQKIQKLLAKNFLDDIQDTINEGYGAAYLLKLQELAGADWLPPYQESLAPFVASSAFVADGLIELPEPVSRLVFTTRGAHLATLTPEGRLTIYPASNPRSAQEGPSASDGNARFVFITSHPTLLDALILRTSAGRVMTWDCQRNVEAVPSFQLPQTAGDAGASLPLVLTTDGQTLIAALPNGGLVAINPTAADGQRILRSNQQRFPRPGDWSTDEGLMSVGIPSDMILFEDESRILTRSETGLWIWDVDDLEVGSAIGPSVPIAPMPDRRGLVVVQDTSRTNAAEMSFDRPRSHLIRIEAQDAGPISLSPDGRYALVGCGNTIRVLELPQGRENVVVNQEKGLWQQKLDRTSAVAVAYRPDGLGLVAVMRDEESGRHWLKAWRSVPPTPVDPSRGRPLAASPDGKRSVNRYPDGSLHVFEGDVHQRVLEMPETDVTLRDLAIDNAGAVTAITSVPRDLTGWYVEGARVWRWAPGAAKATELPANMDLHRKRVVRLSQDGSRAAAIAVGTGQSLIGVYDVNAREPLAVRPLLAEPQPSLAITSVSSVSGSSNLTLIARKDGSFRVLPSNELETYNSLDLRHPGELLDAMLVLPDRSSATQSEQRGGGVRAENAPMVLTVSEDDVVLWDARTGRKIKEIDVHWADAISAAVTEDGQRIAIATTDDLRIIDVASDEKIDLEYGVVGSIRQVRFSRDGQTLAATGRRGAAVWKAPFREQTPQQISDDPSSWRIAFSPDSRMLALSHSDRDVRVYRLEDMSVVRNLPFAADVPAGARFSTDGRLLLTVEGRRARLMNVLTGEPAGEVEMGQAIQTAATILSGQQLQIIAGFTDGTWQVKEPAADNPVGREVVARSAPTIALGEKQPVLAVAGDGHVAISVENEERIHLFDPPGSATTRPGSAVSRTITTAFPVAAIAFTHNNGGILHVENASEDSQYVSLCDITENFGDEVVTRKLPRAGINRIVAAQNWIALDVDSDSQPPPTILRFPKTTVVDNIRDSGVTFDEENYRWKPMTLAEHARLLADHSPAPLDPLASEFWAGWWGAQARRARILNTSADFDRAALDQAYGPLLEYTRTHPGLTGHVPQDVLDQLSAVTPVDPGLTGKPLSDRLAAVLRLPPPERVVLLKDLLPRVGPDVAGSVHAQIARAYVQRLDMLVGYDFLIRPELLDRTLFHITSANAAGFVPDPAHEVDYKPVWNETGFPNSWLPVSELSDRAWELMKPNTEDDNRKALTLLDAACRKDPKSYTPWLHRSIVLGRLDEHERAVENYRTMLANQTIEDKEDLARVWANLGFRYGQWGREHYPQAYEAIARAIEVDPTYTTAYAYRVDLYKEENKLDLALADALKLPADAASDLTRAQVFLAMGRWDEAEKELASMSARDPENPETWLERANTLIDAKNRALLPSAVESATEAIRLESAKAELNNNRLRVYHERRGVALRRMMLLDRAHLDFTEILRIRPTDAFAIAELGAIATSRGKTDEAVRRIRESLEIYDEDSWALDQLARAHLREVPSNLPLALSAADRSVRISAGWLGRRAEIHRRVGGESLELAERDLREAVRRGVDPLQSRASLGIVLLMRNRPDDARAAFEQVLTHSPWIGDDDTRSRAQALALLGRYDQAIAELMLVANTQHPDAERYKVSAQVTLLRAAGGPGRPLAADHPATLIALSALLQHARWADVDYPDLATDYALQAIAAHPSFVTLIAAHQKPLDDPSRHLTMARIALSLATRLRAIDNLPPQLRVDCLQAAEHFQRLARENGATDVQIMQMSREAAGPG